jgi:tetratricopeptide (TPR) repeat protein
MRLNSKWLAVLLILAVIPLSGCNFLSKLRARDNMNKGVKQFTDQKYDAAAQYFEKAVDLDPDSEFTETARMYLAIAYQSQFVPGSTDPKSEEMAQKGIAIFKQVVDSARDPANPSDSVKNAMLSIAGLYYQLKRYPESKEWCTRSLKVAPQNPEAYYRIAVMDFDDSLDKTGVQGEMVDMMTPDEKAKVQANIDEGLTCLAKALEFRPNYFDAMQYENLLWREKAKFEKDAKAKAELELQADKVYQKAIALKLKADQEEAQKPKKIGGLSHTK